MDIKEDNQKEESESEEYQCVHCLPLMNKMLTREGLKSHNHFRHKTYSFSCTKCFNCFLTQIDLETHLNEKHSVKVRHKKGKKGPKSKYKNQASNSKNKNQAPKSKNKKN